MTEQYYTLKDAFPDGDLRPLRQKVKGYKDDIFELAFEITVDNIKYKFSMDKIGGDYKLLESK